MAFRGGGRYVAALALFGVGGLQAAVGFLDIAGSPEALGLAVGIGKTVVGLVVLSAALGVARLRKRGLWLSVVGSSGVVIVYLGPLLAGQTTAISVGSTLASLCLLLYLLLNEDAFENRDPGRELTEETNPHEFIR